MPELPSAEEIQAPELLQQVGWFDVDESLHYLDFSEPYHSPKYTLSWNGIKFAPLGGIHALTGQPGHGKTMTLTQFMVAILAGEFGGLRYELSDDVPHPTLLYIDTEMEKDNTIAVKNRVLTLAGRDINVNYDDFKVVMLREVDKAVERWKMTLKALWNVRPTVCIIDGLLDIVEDFNDNEECQGIIYQCMKVASFYPTSLWCLVHENPNSTKLVGHLGSMLERKVTDVFSTKKERNEQTGQRTFTVSQRKARGRDVDDWKFMVNPTGGWGLPEQIDNIPTDAIEENDDNIDWNKVCQALINAINPPSSKSCYAIRESLKKELHIGSTTANKLINEAKRKGIIVFHSTNQKFTYNGPIEIENSGLPF